MKNFLLPAGLCFVMLACNQYPNDEKDQSTADSIMGTGEGSSSAAVVNAKDSFHQFVRTASVRFQVADVEKTTYRIEDIVTAQGGMVTSTELNSHTDETTATLVHADSVLETIRFTVTNNMTIRVPNTRLDTTLKDIARLVGDLDYRIIKADDVSQQLYANELAHRRSDQHAQRLMQAIDNGSKKLPDITQAETTAQEIETERDATLLSDRLLRDQVRFSTVQLYIYQRQGVRTAMVPHYTAPPPYEPAFGARLLAAFVSGLRVLETIFIGLFHLWPIWILVVLGMLAYRKQLRKTSGKAGSGQAVTERQEGRLPSL